VIVLVPRLGLKLEHLVFLASSHCVIRNHSATGAHSRIQSIM
jgi:hypothetical protein